MKLRAPLPLCLWMCASLPRALGLSCTPDSTNPGCVCTETGTQFRLDLSTAFNYPITVVDKDSTSGRIYSINLCKSIPCGNANFTSVCLNDAGTNYYGCGKPGVAKWTVTSFTPKSFSILYPNGDGKRQSVVTVTEDTKATTNSITMAGITIASGITTYGFEIILGTGSHNNVPPGIVGLTLISVSLVGFCCYMVIGMVIGYRLKGARGTEMIPQWSFWKDLPFLIKDGILLSISPCYKRNSQYTRL